MPELSSNGVSLGEPAAQEVSATPAHGVVPSPRPKASTRHRRWRLRLLLAINAILAVVYAISELDPATAEKLGPAGSFIYHTVHANDDPESISPEGQRLRDEVAGIGGRAAFMDRTYRYLGRFGPVERFSIGISNPKFGDAELAELVKKYGERIGGLSLGGTSVTDQGLRCLADLPQLQQLALGHFDPQTRRSDGAAVERGQLTDAGLIHLKGLNQLRNLHLNNLPITDAGLAAIANLPRLGGLHLYHTKVTGVGLANLKSLPTLVVLYLDRSELTEEGLASLAGAVSLKVLSLREVPLTAKELQTLKSLPRLNMIDLTHCGLLDEEVRDFKKSNPSVKVSRD